MSMDVTKLVPKHGVGRIVGPLRALAGQKKHRPKHAPREANRIIDQRAFSWTNLFSQFEMTLPEDVRIRSVTPRFERDQFIVTVAIEARRAEDVDAFVEALEQAGNFKEVLPLVVETTEEGLLAGVVEATYAAATQPAPAGEAVR